MILEKPRLSIDKVGVRYEYPLGEQGELERKQLYGFKYALLDGDLQNSGKVWKDGKNAMTYMVIQLKGGSKLSINYGYCSKRYWSWVTFNPSRMSEADFDDFRAYTGMLYEQGCHTLWQLGALSRLDIACDVEAEFADHLYLDQMLQVESDQGTLYLGAEKGSRHFRIYDKRKERLEVAGIELGHPLLRIEACLLKPKQYRLGDMHKVENPFLPLLVVDRDKLKGANIPMLNKFQSGLSYGLKPSSCLTYFPSAERKDLFQALPTVAPVWWEPAGLWNSYPDAFDWVHQLFS